MPSAAILTPRPLGLYLLPSNRGHHSTDIVPMVDTSFQELYICIWDILHIR